MNLIRTILEATYSEGREVRIKLRSDRLEGCGFPARVLQRFPDIMPLVISFDNSDVRRGMSPEIGDTDMTCNLSFDALCSVRIPFAAIVSLVVPVDLPEETPEAPKASPPPFLTLVE